MVSKKFLYIQTLVLAGGVLFSWTTLIGQFRTFYGMYGTIWRIRDCVIPNPMVTACFYGSLAFLAAFVWSFILAGKFSYRSQRYLRNFLLFGVLFALSVLVYEFAEYYKFFAPTGAVTCAPGVNPLVSPCFKGLIFFIMAYFVAFVLVRKAKGSADIKI